ncbi:unnamed protein product [Rhizoctonia solani]|uniref:Uncharacterized protein n=1 Tax=Rhizoctonia solani TaxID=456999 RepID=A0A8H3CDT8_9AGAM|nr:unnamed protein product [Rhizoctonia solani]
MPTTRKSTAKSTKIAPHKKGVAVAAPQTQIVAWDNALESQERRISKLNAQVTAMCAGGNVATNSRAEVASGSNVNLDEADGAEDDRGEIHLWSMSTNRSSKYPYLNNLQPPSWPVMEMLKIMLRNKQAYRKRTVPTTAEELPITISTKDLCEVGGV